MLLQESAQNGPDRTGTCMYRRTFPVVAAVVVVMTGLLFSQDGRADHANPFNIVNMVIVDGGMPVGDALGASTMLRDKHGADATINIGDLEPGMTYTVWALAFNRPEKCQSFPCSGATDGAAGKLSVFWVAAGIAATGPAGGVLNLTFRIHRGRPSSTVAGGLPSGLTNVKGGEVHLVMVPHPEAVPGHMAVPMITPGAPVRGAVHLPPG